MKNNSIKTLRSYLYKYSGFTETTVNNIIKNMGFSLNGSGEDFNDLSSIFENCAKHGANCGFSGFIYYCDTIPFFKANRQDIINHMEQTAAGLGEDIITMVQNFGVFRNSKKPTVSEVGKALWNKGHNQENFTTLYNVFAWYAFEEVSRTWYQYLEENPGFRAELSA
jgi:hypothetical protein